MEEAERRWSRRWVIIRRLVARKWGFRIPHITFLDEFIYFTLYFDLNRLLTAINLSNNKPLKVLYIHISTGRPTYYILLHSYNHLLRSVSALGA